MLSEAGMRLPDNHYLLLVHSKAPMGRGLKRPGERSSLGRFRDQSDSYRFYTVSCPFFARASRVCYRHRVEL